MVSEWVCINERESEGMECALCVFRVLAKVLHKLGDCLEPLQPRPENKEAAFPLKLGVHDPFARPEDGQIYRGRMSERICASECESTGCE